MYDEHEYVYSSIVNIKKTFNEPKFVVIHSDNGSEFNFNCVDTYVLLDNLAPTVERIKLPAHAVCRNLSRGFKEMDRFECDIVVVLFGDTHVVDAKSIYRRYAEMCQNDFKIFVTRPLTQMMHGADGTLWSRQVTPHNWDFMGSLFFVNGEFLHESKVFQDIEVCNEYTSEQCLGDELAKKLKDKSKVGVLNWINPSIYHSYTDGINWQMYGAGENRKNG